MSSLIRNTGLVAVNTADKNDQQPLAGEDAQHAIPGQLVGGDSWTRKQRPSPPFLHILYWIKRGREDRCRTAKKTLATLRILRRVISVKTNVSVLLKASLLGTSR